MSETTSAIHTDALDMDDDTAAFLANLTGAEDPRKRHPESEARDEEAPEAEHEETAPAEGTDEAAEPEADDDDPDNTEVEIKVGEETKKATIKELKRLYGQEAALTQKSQKLAESQRTADTRFQVANTALGKMVEKAEAHYSQYAGLDFLVLAQQMDTETFQALRQDAAAAKAQVDFFKEELGGLVKTQQETQSKAYQEAAQTCIKVLSDEKTGIPGFGKELYDDMAKFADKHVGPSFRTVTDPGAIRIVHMAMQWEKAEAARKSAEKKIEASPNKPTRVLRPGSNAKAPQGARQAAMNELRRSGDVESGANAFLATFKS